MSDKPKPKLRVVGKEPLEHETPEDPKPVNLEVIEALKALVERAKEGEIIGCALALQLTDEMVSTDYVGDIVAYQTVGCLESLKLDLLDELREDDD